MGQYFEWVNYDKREIMMADLLPDGQKHQFRYAVNEGRTTPETSSSRGQRAATDALMQSAASSFPEGNLDTFSLHEIDNQAATMARLK